MGFVRRRFGPDVAMRLFVRLAAAVLTLTTALPMVAALSAGAADAAEPACSRPLDPDRRTVYKFRNGGETLGYGQLVVQATAANPHRYCIRFQTGGRTVTHGWSEADYIRSGGSCTSTGMGKGDGGYQSGGYNTERTVRDGRCLAMTFSIRSDGAWYSATFLRWNDPG